MYQGYERCEVKNETPYMSTTSVNVLPRALNNATDIRLIIRRRRPERNSPSTLLWCSMSRRRLTRP
jgi:hypothetical protein